MKYLIYFIQQFTSKVYLRGIPKILFLTKRFFLSKDKSYFLPEGIFINLDLSDYFQHTILWSYYEVGVSYFVKKFLKRGDAFIDVGANIGYFSVLASSIVKESGEVHIFEPNKNLANTIIENFNINHFNNFHLNSLGLSNDDLDKQFVIGVQHAFSQITSSPNEVSFESKEVISIPCITFDEYVSKSALKTEKIKLIKIDAEGHDLHVLDGMKDFLSKHSIHVIFENSLSTLDENPMGNSLLKIVNDYGYNIFKIKYQNASSFFNFKRPKIISVDPNKIEVMENY